MLTLSKLVIKKVLTVSVDDYFGQKCIFLLFRAKYIQLPTFRCISSIVLSNIVTENSIEINCRSCLSWDAAYVKRSRLVTYDVPQQLGCCLRKQLGSMQTSVGFRTDLLCVLEMFCCDHLWLKSGFDSNSKLLRGSSKFTDVHTHMALKFVSQGAP